VDQHVQRWLGGAKISKNLFFPFLGAPTSMCHHHMTIFSFLITFNELEEKPLFNIYSFFRLITNEDRNERMMTDESHNPSDHD